MIVDADEDILPLRPHPPQMQQIQHRTPKIPRQIHLIRYPME